MRHSSHRPSAPPSEGDVRGAYALAGLIFVASSLVLAYPWLSGAVTIPYDAKAEFYPQFAFLARALHTGQSPFWNPNIFDGSPQIADPQSLIFAPVFLLAALLTPKPGFILSDALVFGSLIAGGGALILFFRDRAWHPTGALVAALAFAFGGSAAWRIQHIGEILSFAWLPFALLALSRALDRGSILWGAAAGLCGALILLGRDQVALLEIYLLSAYTIAGIIRHSLRKTAGPLLAGFATGTVVAAIPLALTIALAQQSNRPEISLAEALKGSLHPASLLTLVSANIFGVSGALQDFWGPPSPAWGDTGLFIARNMATLYMGALVVVACGALALTRPHAFWCDRNARFFVFAALAFALFAFGQYTPAFAALYELPGVDLFRRPADATFPLCACIAIIAGYAIHCFAKVRPHTSVLAALVVGLLALCIFTALAKDRLPQSVPAITWAAAFLIASSGLLVRLSKTSLRTGLVAAGLIVTLDLAVSNAPNESTALPPSQFDMLRIGTSNETIAVLKDRLHASATADRRDRVELAGLGFAWPNAGLVHDLDNVLGYNPVRTALFERFTGAGDHVALPEQRVFSKAFPSYRSPAADLSGLRYIVTGVPAEQIDPLLRAGDLTFLTRTTDGYVYENPRALPRVLIATQAIRTDFDALMRSGNWPAVDYASTVLLETPNDAGKVRRSGHAALVAYENTRVVVDADAPDGGWLVLNDVWHPWWRATIDGAPSPILRANGMFRAVALPPGRHVVAFSFHPFIGVIAQLRAALLHHGRGVIAQ